MEPFHTPWIIAFIEGFSTLAVEVIAIRLAIPIVGSSVTLTGVMLGVVLFALSAGYWRGGEASPPWKKTPTQNAPTPPPILPAAVSGAPAVPPRAPLLRKILGHRLVVP